ncbi:MAG: hypothetical protein CM15mL4_0100 [uncultured marine virus]|nr:MAG: hypothetical protein CM15mL4_0100 [uncultured marine virus]
MSRFLKRHDHAFFKVFGKKDRRKYNTYEERNKKVKVKKFFWEESKKNCNSGEWQLTKILIFEKKYSSLR